MIEWGYIVSREYDRIFIHDALMKENQDTSDFQTMWDIVIKIFPSGTPYSIVDEFCKKEQKFDNESKICGIWASWQLKVTRVSMNIFRKEARIIESAYFRKNHKEGWSGEWSCYGLDLFTKCLGVSFWKDGHSSINWKNPPNPQQKPEDGFILTQKHGEDGGIV